MEKSGNTSLMNIILLWLGIILCQAMLALAMITFLLIMTVISKPTNFSINKDQARSYLGASPSCQQTAKILNEANGLSFQVGDAVADPDFGGLDQNFYWTTFNRDGNITFEGKISIHTTYRPSSILYGPKRTAICGLYDSASEN